MWQTCIIRRESTSSGLIYLPPFWKNYVNFSNWDKNWLVRIIKYLPQNIFQLRLSDLQILKKITEKTTTNNLVIVGAYCFKNKLIKSYWICKEYNAKYHKSLISLSKI